MDNQLKKTAILIQSLGIKHGQEIYDTLGVNLSAKDLDPESYYNGMPHPFTGKILPEKYQCKTMVKDLLATFGQPICIQKTSKETIIWTKGDDKSWYEHDKNGHYYSSSYHFVKKEAWSKPIKMKYVNNGYYGMGLNWSAGVKKWGVKLLTNLPTVKEYEKNHPEVHKLPTNYNKVYNEQTETYEKDFT